MRRLFLLLGCLPSALTSSQMNQAPVVAFYSQLSRITEEEYCPRLKLAPSDKDRHLVLGRRSRAEDLQRIIRFWRRGFKGHGHMYSISSQPGKSARSAITGQPRSSSHTGVDTASRAHVSCHWVRKEVDSTACTNQTDRKMDQPGSERNGYKHPTFQDIQLAFAKMDIFCGSVS